jgi:hypothetical protein
MEQALKLPAPLFFLVKWRIKFVSLYEKGKGKR